jgi:hypothetical protein
VDASAGEESPRSATSTRPPGSRRGFNNNYYVQTKGKLHGNFTRSDKLKDRATPGEVRDGEVLVELTAEQAKGLWKIKDHSQRKTYMLGLADERTSVRNLHRNQCGTANVQDDHDWWDDDLADAAEQFAEEYVRQAGRQSSLTVDEVVAGLGTQPKDMLYAMLDVVHNEWEGENEDLADKWLTKLEDLQDLAPAGVFDKKHSAGNRRAA